MSTVTVSMTVSSVHRSCSLCQRFVILLAQGSVHQSHLSSQFALQCVLNGFQKKYLGFKGGIKVHLI